MFEVCFESKSPMGKYGNPLHHRLGSRNYFYYIDIMTNLFMLYKMYQICFVLCVQEQSGKIVLKINTAL